LSFQTVSYLTTRTSRGIASDFLPVFAERLRVDTKQQTPYLWGMEVEPTPDQTAFIKQAIAAGRLRRPEEAAQEAFSLWEERERRRMEILAAVDVAEASLARGEGRIITEESMRQLAEDVKRRGRARLAAEQQAPR
jgi:hypothetical protein